MLQTYLELSELGKPGVRYAFMAQIKSWPAYDPKHLGEFHDTRFPNSLANFKSRMKAAQGSAS